jgi:hypothetical protein
MPQFLGAEPGRVRKVASEHFDQIFAAAQGGWMRASTAATRSVLITWTT